MPQKTLYKNVRNNGLKMRFINRLNDLKSDWNLEKSNMFDFQLVDVTWRRGNMKWWCVNLNKNRCFFWKKKIKFIWFIAYLFSIAIKHFIKHTPSYKEHRNIDVNHFARQLFLTTLVCIDWLFWGIFHGFFYISKAGIVLETGYVHVGIISDGNFIQVHLSYD